MTERPDLKTPGRLLSGARRAKGLSLAEVAERTKIPPPVLEALEADEYHKVSGALYIKSFLRTCAVELDVDADEVLALYGGMSGEGTGPRAGDMVWDEEEVQISHVGLPWRGIALAGAALVLVGLVSLLLLRGCGGESAETAGGDRRSDEQAGETAPEPGAAPVAAVRDTGTSAVVGADSLDGAGPTDPPGDQPAVADTEGDQTRAAGSPADGAPSPQPAVALSPEPEVAVERPRNPTNSGTGGAAAGETGPLPVVGDRDLVFAGGAQYPVVVRVICDEPTQLEVRRDGERGFAAVAWPADPATAPALPPRGMEPGRVYGIRRGYAIYFGADDNMGLRLDSTSGVEVRVNGNLRDISNLRAGVELLLDAAGN